MSINELFTAARRAAGIAENLGELDYPNINGLLAAAIRRFGTAPAVSSLGCTLDFSEIHGQSSAFASFIQNHTDLQPGDRIAIQMPNLIQYVVVFFGAIRAGLVVVNTNPLYTPREMEHQFKDSGAKALVLLANMAANAQDVIPKTDIKHVIVTELADLHPWPKRLLINKAAKYLKKMVPPYSIPGSISLRRALALGHRRPHREVQRGSEDLAVLQYTGGTTGVSKGAMLSHRNVVVNVQQAGAIATTYTLPKGQELLLLPLPLYHIYAFNACMGMMSRGAHTVLIPNPRDLDSLIDAFERWPVTGFAGLTTLFVALCNAPRFRALDFSRLSLTLSGGMALTLDAAQQWQDVTGCAVVEGYGLTETSPCVSVNPVNKNRLGTIGVPVPGTEVSIRDDDGKELGVDQPGELCVRGPQVMQGYWQCPDETAKVLSPDGWLRTGDVAIVTAEGYLKIVDRKKDMIVVSGFNVYPNEIEEVVVSHPDVIECAAVGVPDARTGEAVRVFVVRRNESLTENALREHCKTQLTGYKVPKQFVFRADLPKSNVGKILRRELRDAP